jgi:hypothetical protein
MIQLRVTTHSGEDDVVEVESYDPIQLNEKINDYQIQSILLGKNLYSRIDLKNVKPIENVESIQ